jgi:uroporphyrinogen III methyltransferase/synthase
MRPLQGRSVIVTRAREQASRLVALLQDAGAEVVEVPVIAFAPPDDGGAALQAALAHIDRYRWMVVTSANGVDAVATAAGESLGTVPFAVVGPATADALRRRGIEPALVPERFVAEGLLDAFPSAEPGGRVLVAQADLARPVLVDGLRARGWEVDAVTAYRTVPAPVDEAARAAITAADAVTFTSASTVENFVASAGVGAVPSVVVTIGPITTAAANALGIEVTAEADPHSVDGVVHALLSLPPSVWGGA